MRGGSDVDSDDLRLPRLSEAPWAVVIDLDGTLLDPSGALSTRGAAALEAVLARGVPVVIATARPARSVRAKVGPLFERVSVVQMSGVGLVHAGAVTRLASLAPEAAARVIVLAGALAPHARIVAEIEGHEFGVNHAMHPDELWAVNAATPDMLLSLEAALERGVAKLAVNGLGVPLAEMETRLRSELGGTLEVIADRSGSFLNLVPSGVSKEAALHHLWRERTDPWRGGLAFGDDLADLEMLRLAEHGVAMANALPPVLAAVPYRTASNEVDGVAIALEALA
ncbi:MAG: HAD family hydrolase [Dehalococcoidia bacterium]|nr:HAD family hydrolase [Dehalococcoidia bacterium]